MSAKARRRPPVFPLTAQERVFLALYRTVSSAARESAGQVLFDAWTNPLEHEKDEAHGRWNAASRQLKLGALTVSTFDQVRAGARESSRAE